MRSRSRGLFSLQNSAMELNFDDSDEDTVDFSPSNEEGRSADQSRLTVHDMYERLDSLQLLHEQNKSKQRKLVCGQNLFTTLDRSSTCDFEFTLDSFRTDEVFCIEIIDTKYEVVSDPGFKSKRMSLEVSLFLQEDKSFELNSRRQLFSPIRNSLGNRNRPPLKPDSLVDGFSFALTTADISTGNYILSINNYGDSQQSVRICYSVHTRVFSTPISQGKVKGCVQSNEMHFFSVVLPNPQLLLTLRLQSRPPGDADLLVTNRFKAMVKLTRESAVWQSTLGGDEVLHIHPDDERTKAGNVFLIGVFGYKDGSSEYTLEVTFSQPPPIKLLSSAMSNIDFSLAHGQIAYFAIPINASKKGSTLIVIGERSQAATDDVFSADKLSVKRMRKSHTQHVILTSDSLFELGILEDAAVYRRLARNVPVIQPILYMSTTNMYPDAANFSWRASSSDGIAIAELYHQEFISLSSPPLMCYFSICCHHICRALQQDDECASPLSCKTTFTLRTLPFQKLETTSNNFAYEKKEEMENLYTMLESSCGAYISQRDRTAAHLMENASYTYCETDPASMCTLLHQCKLSDGLVFYDLGSGIGSALGGVLLSGVAFSRVVGIEALPGLCQASSEILYTLKTDLAQRNGTHRSSPTSLPPFELRCGDMRELDWSDADVVFFSSICYSDNLMESIHSALCALKPLSLLITLKLFEDYEGYFSLKGHSYLQMSFGRVTVYILQRK